MTVARQVPHNLDAEESLIGAMLLANSMIEEISAYLMPEDFYSPGNADIFRAQVALWQRGEPVDIVSLAQELTVRGRLDDVGGPQALLSFQTRVPATSNAPRYARIITELATLRRLIKAGGDIADIAYDQPDSVAEAVDHAREIVASVDYESTQFISPGLSTLDEFLDRPEEESATWLIPGIVREGWRIMLVAGEGSGKSVLLRQIAVSAAAGLHPFTHRPTFPIRSLVVDAENPDEAIDSVCEPMRAEAIDRVEWEPDNCWLWRQPGGLNLRDRRDRVAFEGVLRASRPDVVCLGPIYKTYISRGKNDEEGATRETIAALDDLRVRYNFALIMEHHAPLGDSSSKRDIRPHGSAFWSRWPEIGIALIPVTDNDTSLELGRFRGDRLQVQWPSRIDRSGGAWMWSGTWPAGTFDPEKPADTEPMF